MRAKDDKGRNKMAGIPTRSRAKLLRMQRSRASVPSEGVGRPGCNVVQAERRVRLAALREAGALLLEGRLELCQATHLAPTNVLINRHSPAFLTCSDYAGRWLETSIDTVWWAPLWTAPTACVVAALLLSLAHVLPNARRFQRRLPSAMGKQESSFYVIHKPDDAFDRAWASAAATPTPPKPDEGLWTDRKHAVRARTESDTEQGLDAEAHPRRQPTRATAGSTSSSTPTRTSCPVLAPDSSLRSRSRRTSRSLRCDSRRDYAARS